MSFKLSKAQIAMQTKLASDLAAAAEAVSEAITAYNEVLAEAREFCADIAETAQSEWDDKSEKWQEGERAADAKSWIDEWTAADFEEMEEPDYHTDTLSELPEAAS